MRPKRAIPPVLALAGFVTIVVGVHQGLVHVAPGFEGTITTGWDGALSHEEVLLARLGLVGVVGAGAALRWRRLAVVPVATGAVVLFYALRSRRSVASRCGSSSAPNRSCSSPADCSSSAPASSGGAPVANGSPTVVRPLPLAAVRDGLTSSRRRERTTFYSPVSKRRQ
jgi:hypothetical protein